ncbi:MAG: hypothetical protein RIB57_03195 [Pelagibacterium sp.]|uniref:hypothetical protein n=1 Tax=Pelagibacterium sp. TaxID=1967288 RepID=UPI0032EF5926
MVATIGSIRTTLDVDQRPLAAGLRASGGHIRAFEKGSNQAWSRMGRHTSIAERERRRQLNLTTAVTRTASAAMTALLVKTAAITAPFLAVSKAISLATTGLTEFDALAKQIRFAGFADSDRFQGIQHLLDLGGVSAEQSAKAFQDFNRAMGQMSEGTGRAYSQLKILHPELLAQLQTLTTQEQRVDAVAEALRGIDDTSRRAAIGQALFGSEGAKMAQILSEGASAIDRATAAARNMGIVVDRDVLANVEKMNDELGVAQQIMDVQLKQAAISIIPVLIGVAQGAAAIASGIRLVGDAMHFATGNFDSMSTGSIEQRMQNIGAERVRLENEILQLRGEDTGFDPLGWATDDKANQIEHLSGQLSTLADEERRLLDVLNNRPSLDIDVPDIEIDVPELGGGGASARADEALRTAEAVAELVRRLQDEKAAIHLSATEQRILNDLRGVGIERNSAMGESIAQMIREIEAEKGAVEALQGVLDEAQSLTQSLATDLAKAFMAGEDGAEAMNNAIGRLRDRLLEMGLNQVISSLFQALAGAFGGSIGGGIGGSWSTTAGGANFAPNSYVPGGYFPGIAAATGGFVSGAGTGKSDSIAARLSNGEFVVNADATSRNRTVLESINSGAAAADLFGSTGMAARQVAPVADMSRIDFRHDLNIRVVGDGAEVKSHESRSDGGMRVDDVVLGVVQKGLADGKMDGMFKRLYGLNRRGV